MASVESGKALGIRPIHVASGPTHVQFDGHTTSVLGNIAAFVMRTMHAKKSSSRIKPLGI